MKYLKNLSLEKLSFFLQILTLSLLPLYVVRFRIILSSQHPPSLLTTLSSFPFECCQNKIILPTTLLEILVLATILVTFLAIVETRTPFKSLRTRLDPFIAIFLITAIIATFKSYNVVGGVGILKAYFIEPILLFYCFLFSIKKHGYSFVITSLLVSGVWISLLSIIQKITGQFTLAPYEIIQGRVSAVYNSANSLALYIAPILLLTFYKVVTVTKRTPKIVYSILLLLFIFIMLLTRSRGGTFAEIGAVLIMLYTFLCFKSRVLRKVWYVIPLAISALAFVLVWQFYQTTNFIPNFTGTPYTQGDTLQIRYFIWYGTVRMIEDHPITGAGLNGFKTLYASNYRLPHYQEEFQYPHNLLLTFWTETGIYGLFSFVLLIVASISLILRELTKHSNWKLGITLIGILSYWLLHGLVDVPYFKNDLSIEFWVVILLIIAWSKNLKEEK